MKQCIVLWVSLLFMGALSAQYCQDTGDFSCQLSKTQQDGAQHFLFSIQSNRTPRGVKVEYEDDIAINMLDYQINGHRLAYTFLKNKSNQPEWLQSAIEQGEYLKISPSLYVKAKNKTFYLPRLKDIVEVKVGFLPRVLQILAMAQAIDKVKAKLYDNEIQLNDEHIQLVAESVMEGTFDEYDLLPAKPHPIRMNIQLQQGAVNTKNKVILDVSLQNTSDQGLYVCKRLTPFGHPRRLMSNIFHVLHQGKKVPYTGIMAKRGPVSVDEMVYIPAGESLDTSLILSNDYDLSQEGSYFITFNRNLLYFSEQKEISGLDIFNLFIMHSNTVQLEVVGE